MIPHALCIGAHHAGTIMLHCRIAGLETPWRDVHASADAHSIFFLQ
jgi:hypothetical protein